MLLTRAVLLATTLTATALAQSGETIIGVYIFSRHGDRTPKSLPPTNLTALGYTQVYERGQYYRNRYIDDNAPSRIMGINPDTVRLAQLSVVAPVDNVLQNSAVGFLQGLYPPVGDSLATQSLRNGSSVAAPMEGYQLIPVNTIVTGAGSEDNGWLQDATNCANAKTSSNNYFTSEEYTAKLGSTRDFYQRLNPVVNGTFSADANTFKNAYTVFDYINVAEIHNDTIPSSDLLDGPTLAQLRALANAHEFGLAYNATDDARAVAGMQLAGEVLAYLNATLAPRNFAARNNKLGVQFGAYATALSFFGLAGLPAADARFAGVNGYASTMVFELFTTAPVDDGTPPAAADLQVRFLWHNGSDEEAGLASAPAAYPLFGQAAAAVSWDAFVGNMSRFAIRDDAEWCAVCGNFTGSCAAYAPGGAGAQGGGAGASASKQGGGGMSAAVAGVIGAMVTLAVVLGVEGLVLLLAGLRLVSKKRMAGAGAGPVVEEAKA